tara:strand:+ start:78 stop:299 length:222 start_codon:yes stop_codon:yes gene_type:complete
MLKFISIVCFVTFFLITNSNAYLGPGLGLGIIASTLGVIIAVLLGIFGIIWFPIKRLLKKNKSKNKKNKKADN